MKTLVWQFPRSCSDNFLVSIGVDPEVAEFDAEGIEHHVSEETLAVFAVRCRL